MGKIATKGLRAKVTKRTSRYVSLRIDKGDFEVFCDSCGLYRKEFLDLLEKSGRDSQLKRVTERKSLYELIKT
jgi:hypothetical protein